MIQIIPSILATTEEEYKEKIDKIATSPSLQEGWVHIDLMDNEFVQNESISPEIVRKYPLDYSKEVHLMVDDPMSSIKELADFTLNRYITHIEIGEDKVKELLDHVKQNLSKEAGLAINPETPLEKLTPFMATIDSLLIMTVHPGQSGQDFLEGSLGRIKQAVALRSTSQQDFLIGVDGGVTIENLKSIVEAGADYVTMAHALFTGDIDENLEKIWEIIR